MFKLGLPPIPNDDHVKSFSKSFSKHKQAIDDIENDLKNYYQKCLFSFSQSTIEELQPVYEKLIQSGVKFAESFGSFIQKFLPILKSASDLETKYSLMKQAFSNYVDNIRDFRNEETKENYEKEEKSLLDFVEKFTRFNTDSNSLSVCFLMLYVASITQLSYDASAFLQSLTKLIENLPQIEKSKEEAEVDQMIEQLEKEIAEKKARIQQKKKEEQERRAKAEKEKQEKEQKAKEQQQAEKEKQQETQPQTESEQQQTNEKEQQDTQQPIEQQQQDEKEQQQTEETKVENDNSEQPQEQQEIQQPIEEEQQQNENEQKQTEPEQQETPLQEQTEEANNETTEQPLEQTEEANQQETEAVSQPDTATKEEQEELKEQETQD